MEGREWAGKMRGGDERGRRIVSEGWYPLN
jgi:hypothetical protein